jgi:stage III sporulation protein AD
VSGVSLAGLAVVVALLTVVVRQYKAEYGMAVGIAGGILLLLLVVAQMSGLFDALSEMIGRAGIQQEWLALLLKALGICYVTQFAADCCRDAGESALASKAELAGRVAVVVLALPMLTQLLENIVGMLA